MTKSDDWTAVDRNACRVAAEILAAASGDGESVPESARDGYLMAMRILKRIENQPERS